MPRGTEVPRGWTQFIPCGLSWSERNSVGNDCGPGQAEVVK